MVRASLVAVLAASADRRSSRRRRRRRSAATRSATCATSLDRSKVTVAGAAIVEVHHREVVVTANRRTVRRLRRLGLHRRAHRRRQAARHGAGRRVPARRRGVPRLRRDGRRGPEHGRRAYPGLVSRFSLGRSYQGREIWAAKVSDNVAVDEAEPEVLFTANQHAREHLTVEMALYILRELTSKYATDARDQERRRQPRDLDRLHGQPRRRRVRHRHRRLPLVAQEPPAERHARSTSAPTSTATGASSGAAAAARRGAFSSETYRGAVGVLGARDAAAA